jgi:hypothetical protein
MSLPVMQDFFEVNEVRLFDRWRASPDPQERDILYLQLQGLQAFKDYLNQVLIDGSMAKREIEEENNKSTN